MSWKKEPTESFRCFKCFEEFEVTPETVYCPNCKQLLRKTCVICGKDFLKDSTSRQVCYNETCLKIFRFNVGISNRYWVKGCNWCHSAKKSTTYRYCSKSCSLNMQRCRSLIVHNFKGEIKNNQLILLDLLGKDYLKVIELYEFLLKNQVVKVTEGA